MKDWAPARQNLSAEEKLEYKEKARVLTNQTTNKPQAAENCLRKLLASSSHLILLKNGSFFIITADAIGQQQVQFPYKKVLDGDIIIHGFPEYLPIKTISNYGENDLNEILLIKELVVENQSHHQIENDDSQVAAIGIVTHAFTSQPITHTLSSPPVTHTLPSPPVTHTLPSPPVANTLPSPPVTNTLPSPPVASTLTSTTITHTITSPPDTHTLTSPTITHTLTSPTNTHTLISPPVIHTSKRPRGTAANKTKATKKRKNNQERGVNDIITTRTVGDTREYLLHWDGFGHAHDAWGTRM
ncbi:unnamed protein product [Mytilus coruscus]|uniref:Chromo domain-containing protein n=1 Tax=Mytilus coruscus TaxID=42192 RepID=A0A6J8C6Z3_MYTCO|nr:unnamed protein product [Mytilus coruscus]